MNLISNIRRSVLHLTLWMTFLWDLGLGDQSPNFKQGCKVCEGSWGSWNKWSECAGGMCNEKPGRMTRMRPCLIEDSNVCNERVSKSCVNDYSCIGDWGKWSEWSKCAINKRSEKCEKIRTRKCGVYNDVDASLCAGGSSYSSENASCGNSNCSPPTHPIVKGKSIPPEKSNIRNTTKVTILRSQNNHNPDDVKKQQQKIFVIVGAGVGGLVACGFILFFVVHIRNKNNPVAGGRYTKAGKLRCVSHSSSATEGYSSSGITSPSTEVFEFTLNDLPVRELGSRSGSNVSANNEFTFLRREDRSLTRDAGHTNRQENIYWEINDSRRKSMTSRPYSFAEELPLSKKLAGSKHIGKQQPQITAPCNSNQTAHGERLVVDNILYTGFSV